MVVLVVVVILLSCARCGTEKCGYWQGDVDGCDRAAEVRSDEGVFFCWLWEEAAEIYGRAEADCGVGLDYLCRVVLV